MEGIMRKPDEINFSYSLNNKFDDFSLGGLCPRQFRDVDLLKLAEREPSDVMIKGLRYEGLVFGFKDEYRGEIDPSKPLLTARGKETADELRIQALADKTQRILKYYGFKDLEPFKRVSAQYENEE